MLTQKINMIKAITFPQFLDCVFAISQLKEPSLFHVSPKAALQKAIIENFMPLLQRIESMAANSLTQKAFLTSHNQNFVYSKFCVAQRQIIFNGDTQAIFADIQPLMRSLYLHYFDMEVNSQKNAVRKSELELRHKSFSGCIQFCKDF